MHVLKTIRTFIFITDIAVISSLYRITSKYSWFLQTQGRIQNSPTNVGLLKRKVCNACNQSLTNFFSIQFNQSSQIEILLGIPLPVDLPGKRNGDSRV